MDVSSVYFDDVLIMSTSWMEHVVHLERVSVTNHPGFTWIIQGLVV